MKLTWVRQGGVEGAPLFRSNIGPHVTILVHRGIGGCSSGSMEAELIIGKNVADQSFDRLRRSPDSHVMHEWSVAANGDDWEKELKSYCEHVEYDINLFVLNRLHACAQFLPESLARSAWSDG